MFHEDARRIRSGSVRLVWVIFVRICWLGNEGTSSGRRRSVGQKMETMPHNVTLSRFVTLPTLPFPWGVPFAAAFPFRTWAAACVTWGGTFARVRRLVILPRVRRAILSDM